jgi:hypothetical protein
MGEPGSVVSLVWYEDLRVLRNHQPHSRGRGMAPRIACTTLCVYNTAVQCGFYGIPPYMVVTGDRKHPILASDTFIARLVWRDMRSLKLHSHNFFSWYKIKNKKKGQTIVCSTI